MKKLIKHMALLILPVVILLVIMPVDQRMKYAGLKNDCFNHGIWIHDRIHHNPKGIDIAFLGSSHTINGIDDGMITAELYPLIAVNFAYCRLGRNLDYVILKETLKKKQIKKLVIEVKEREDRYSHPVFPFIGSTADVFLPQLFFNRDIVKDIWNHLSYKVEIYQEICYMKDSVPVIRLEEFGFAGHHDTASAAFLEEMKVKRGLKRNQLSPFQKAFYLRYPEGYLSKISRLCREKQIELYFLYLPSYGNHTRIPEAMTIYGGLGTILIPPGSIFENKSNWHDENHLNIIGARLLSQWVADQL